jgi:short-subunit dehydrogenase
LKIAGKVVLITGASRGIGAACAEAFLQRSALLALTARTVPGELEESERVLFTAGDITNSDDRARVVDATLKRFGRIDILINNAGQGSYQPALRTEMASARALFELNYFAPLALMQLVVPYMRRQGGGTVVNVGSIAGQVALPWMPVYSSTKFALGALTDALRLELKPAGIRTMMVCPGYVETPFHEHAIGTPPAIIAGAKRFAISPQRCAAAIVRGVERNSRTVVTPAIGWSIVWLDRFFPSLIEARLSGLSK